MSSGGVRDLSGLSVSLKHSLESREFAEEADKNMAFLRNDFFYPKMKQLPHVDLSMVDGEEDSIYMCGNSLGLQPKGVKYYTDRELDKWAQMGVFGHFEGELPWAFCDEYAIPGNAQIVGAKEEEIGIMNGLSVNLHLLMVNCLLALDKKQRNKILLESKAFPSDHYAMESQIRLHGLDPAESMICLEPRDSEYCLRTEDILSTIRERGSEIALVFFSGVQYYTAQLFDIETITKAGHDQGCVVGWDLAHAAGNVPLKLHDWNVDFAAWCTYKYMNSSCGGLAGVFIHERHAHNDYPRLTGWWGHTMDTRFKMDNKMELSDGPSGYRISNPPMLLICPMLVFAKTSMNELREKSLLLTGYLEYLVLRFFGRDSPHRKTKAYCEILTPTNPAERGCQLSLKFSVDLNTVFDQVRKRGIVCDKRLPFVLRIAPTPMYNGFLDVWRFYNTLSQCLEACE